MTIQIFQVRCDPDLHAIMHNVAEQLAPTLCKTHAYDVKHFARWMAHRDLTLQSLSHDDLVVYRTHLSETYADVTASCLWAVARQLHDEAVQRQVLANYPAEGIRGFRAGDDESPHQALKREEARAFLDAIDRSTALDKRDYALIMLLLRTGLRRSKAVALTLSDLMIEQGYHVAIIRHCTSWTQRGIRTLAPRGDIKRGRIISTRTSSILCGFGQRRSRKKRLFPLL